jgi:hypothetical protein
MHTLHAHPSTESVAIVAPRARRVGLLDRVALHLGVALIKWGRRPAHHAARTERVANRAELALLHRDRQFALASLEREGAGIANARLIRIG